MSRIKKEKVEKYVERLKRKAPDYAQEGRVLYMIGENGYDISNVYTDGLWEPSVEWYLAEYSNNIDAEWFAEYMPRIFRKFFKGKAKNKWERIFWDNLEEIEKMAEEEYWDVLMHEVFWDVGIAYGTSWEAADPEELLWLCEEFGVRVDEDDIEDDEDE